MGWDALLVDGTNLEIEGTRIVQVWEGVHSGAPLRGQNPDYPGVDGERRVDKPFGAHNLSIGLMVRGGAPDVTGFNDAYRTLRRLCKPGKQVTLTRRLSYAGGDESQTCAAELVAITPSQLTPADYRVVVEFRLLDGLWYGAEETIASGTVTVKGDVRTQRMTITLPGGVPAPTVTNTTNGYAFTFGGTLATATDIDNETATAIRGGIDVSNALTWTKQLPFRLEPGSNTITIDSGTVSIAYRPAYL